MLGGDLNALGGFKDRLFEYGAVFTEADNKEATMFCYVLFRLAEHQVALAAKDLTGENAATAFQMITSQGLTLHPLQSPHEKPSGAHPQEHCCN